MRSAQLDEAGVLGRSLAAAFEDDPVFGWLIPVGVDRRAQRLETFFSSMCRSYLRRGKRVLTDGGGSAAALWSAPGSWRLPLSEVVREARPSLSAFGSAGVVRALQVQRGIERAHPVRPEHWYLGYLGVAPAGQRQGLGGRLLDEVLVEADRSGVAAYLESSNEKNLSLYGRHGFVVVEQIRVHGSPPFWRMWREPGGG